MATSSYDVRFRDGLSDEFRAGGEQAVAGMAESLQRDADDRAALRAERDAIRATLIGDAPVDPSPPEALRQSLDVLRTSRVAGRVLALGQPAAFSLALHPGLTVQGLPYDYEWHWRAAGTKPPSVSIAEELSGLMSTRGESCDGDDRVDAACGVGFVVTSDVRAQVQVRPYVRYGWHYFNHAHGPFSHAESEGGINLAAWVDDTCASVGCVKSARLFRDAVSPGEVHDRSEEGTVYVPDVTLDFQVEPGRRYYVNLASWVRCDHTAGVSLPASCGFGMVEAHAQFAVVERFTSG
jgi:hypothetical protein